MEISGLLKQLIAIPSVSPSIAPLEAPTGEADICNFLQHELEHFGIPCELIEALPGRPNLYARLDFGQPQTVILTAHTDTVTAVGWDGDPYDPREIDGEIWGRGSCDTKASLAVLTWVTLEAHKRNQCKYNLVFAALCDEEAGFGGSKAAAKHLKAEFVIAGEPTSLRVLNRHKGVARFVMSSRGRSCHSSTPEMGRNAIYPLAQAALRLEAKCAEWAQEPHPIVGPRTLAVTTISGGLAPNVIPDWCQAMVEVRLIPGDSSIGLRDELAEYVGGEVEIAPPHMDGPALDTDAAHPLVKELIECTGKPHTWAAYCTDAAMFAAEGIPSVVFGPGNSALAHTRQERVPITDLNKSVEILLRFLGT